MAESIVVKDHGMSVEEVPERSSISLALLESHGRGITVSGDVIAFGSFPHEVVLYRIVGWDALHHALEIERTV